jgi:predicted transcriptional regulator
VCYNEWESEHRKDRQVNADEESMCERIKDEIETKRRKASLIIILEGVLPGR